VKKIQILGPGCPKCKKLAEFAEQAAKAAGSDFLWANLFILGTYAFMIVAERLF
jgi:thiol-disulfide isomerase/thioredoxin